MRWILIILLAYILKSGDATASHGMATWDNLWGKPKFARVALDSSYHGLTDTPVISAVGLSNSYNDLDNKPNLFSGDYDDLTNKPSLFNGDYNNLTNKPALFNGDYNSLTNRPNLNLYMQYSDTGSWIATKNNISVENKAMKDTAEAIRASFPSLSSYVKFTDTSLNIATRYDIFVQNKAMKDSIAALRLLLTSNTSNKIYYWNSSGRVTADIHVWTGIITPTTATNQAIDISSTGFTSITDWKVQLMYNGTILRTLTPNTISNTTLTVDIFRENDALVSILGISVVNGLGILTANDLPNTRLSVRVEGLK